MEGLSGFRVQGGFRVWGLGFRVQGLKVRGFGEFIDVYSVYRI